jgi:alpha-L-fucosidase 2
MLVQSQHGVIELLPACPTAWSDGTVSGLCARGGYELSFSWHDGKVTECTVKARRNGIATLLVNGKEMKQKLKAGLPTIINIP